MPSLDPRRRPLPDHGPEPDLGLTTELGATFGATGGATGVLAALEEELAPLRALVAERPRATWTATSVLGLDVVRFALALPGVAAPAGLLVVCSGVGKVAAAHAVAALAAAGATRLLVVGTCGGLHPATPVGALVHADVATQWDLAVRAGREHRADRGLLAAWRAVAGGEVGHVLTADRPAVRLLERWRRQRALSRAARAAAPPGSRGAGPRPLAVADMETAAAAAVAARLGLPWAALRAVTDAARPGAAGAFAANLASQGGRAAATIPALLARLAASP